jgi:hypothetical protein
MTNAKLSWQTQIWAIMIPTVVYGLLFWGQSWPKAKSQAEARLGENFKAILTPLFLFILGCMALTAISEFGPTQWVNLILSSSGAKPMLVLALITGTMAVARFFGGDAVHQFNTTGVLLISSVLATLGLFLFSTQTGSLVYAAAFIYALGIAYFWPNMIGFVAKYIPNSGALGMSLVGAMGMFSSSIFQPIIGKWIDDNKVAGAAQGLTETSLELYTGQTTLGTMIFFPAILIGLFTLLYFWIRSSGKH